MGGKWVLVDYGKNFYAYGTEKDLNSFFGFPVNQCGTKAEILSHCKSIAKLCRKNIEKYNQEFVKKQTNGWKILIEQEQRELEMLMEFIKVLDR